MSDIQKINFVKEEEEKRMKNYIKTLNKMLFPNSEADSEEEIVVLSFKTTNFFGGY